MLIMRDKVEEGRMSDASDRSLWEGSLLRKILLGRRVAAFEATIWWEHWLDRSILWLGNSLCMRCKWKLKDEATSGRPCLDDLEAYSPVRNIAGFFPDFIDPRLELGSDDDF